MKNVLLMAFSKVLVKYRAQYMQDHGIKKVTDARYDIAEKWHVSFNTLRALESATKIPSNQILQRMLSSGVYPFNFASASSLLVVLSAIGEEQHSHALEKVAKLVSSTPDLYQLVYKFILAFGCDEQITDEMVKSRLDEFSLVRALEDYLNPVVKGRYYARFVDDPTTFDEVLSLWKQAVPDSTSTTTPMIEDWEYNKTSKTVIYRDPHCTQMIGYYGLKPFNEYGMQCVLDGSLITSTDLELDQHFAKSFMEASCIFVGHVVSTDTFTAGYVVAEMFNQLSFLFNSGKLKCIATKGLTPAGRSLMRRFDFQPLPNSSIHVVHINDAWLERHNIPSILSYR